ncbi:MAG: riboflavin kinase [Clostridia bacterium]|nr:riboflavin kinase [Clostridia bacterium]
MEIKGIVVRGKGAGKKIGFPTANVALPEDWSLPYGVYAADVRRNGEVYRAVLNVGLHPTLPEGAPAMEVHLIGFTGDLYGQEIHLTLGAFIRAETRFSSVKSLRAQIRRDVADALRMSQTRS